MSAASDIAVPAGTETDPVTGQVGRCGVAISDVEHWRNGRVYFIRSTEFDCYAEDEDFATAVRRFGETAEDLAAYLAELVRNGEASENERQVYDLLSARFMELYRCELRELDKARARIISVNISRSRRRRRGVGANWVPRTTRSSSSQPSPA